LEAAGFCWRDIIARDGDGQITVYGKGGKTRVVLLPLGVWHEMSALRGGGTDHDAPVSAPSRAGTWMSRRSTVW
jgi:integrase/recombinase XerD